MRTFPRRITVAVAAAAAAVAVGALAQADAAVRYTSVVDGRAIASTSQSSIPTLVASSGSTTQQWVKTSVGGGFFTLRGVSSGRCLAGSFSLPFMTTCDAARHNQHWHRGFVSDKRLENRASRLALTASGFRLEMRVLSGLQSQRWNELGA
jgi:hypothetical protein